MSAPDSPSSALDLSLVGAPAAGRPLRYWSWWLPALTLLWAIAFFTLLPRPGEVLAEGWPLILVGFGGAVIGNLTAVGGGLVFVPATMIFYQMPPVAALKLALLAQSAGMTSGAVGWLKRDLVPRELLAVTVPALLAGSTLSTLVIQPSALLVKGLFGPVSVGIGLLTLLLLRGRPGRDSIPSRSRLPLAIIAFLGGLLTGWVAIGVGEVVAAFLMLAYGLRGDRSIALGVVLLSIDSIFLALLHVFALGGVPWEAAALTMLGCLYGGRLGPHLSQWVSVRWMKITFAAVAIADGLLFIWQFLIKG